MPAASVEGVGAYLRGYVASLHTPCVARLYRFALYAAQKAPQGAAAPLPEKSIQQVLIKLDLPGSILGFPVCRTSVVSPNGEIDDAENAFNAAIIVGKQIMYEVDKCFVIGGLTRFGRAGFRAEK